MAGDKAQFAIDIAAAMPAGERTVAELDVLTAKLLGAGVGADDFRDAIARASNGLDSARAASTAANEALAIGNEQYAMLERAALQAAKAAERAALKNGGVVPPDLLARAASASNAVNSYAGTLRALESRAREASGGEKQLALALANTKKLSGEAARATADLARTQKKAFNDTKSGIGVLSGSLGPFGQRTLGAYDNFSKLSGALGVGKTMALVAAASVAAVTVAVVALTAAAAAGAIALAGWAVVAANGKRSADLEREAFEQLNPEVAQYQGLIGNVARETGLADSEIRGIGKTLKAAGVETHELGTAMRAAAIAEAALGSGAAGEFIDQIKEGKLTVDEFANNMQAKFGGIVERKMLSLESQTERLKRNLSGLFGGLNIDPVLLGFERLVSLFDEQTVAGETIKFLFEEIFQPLINQAEKAAYVIEAFALGFLIGLTKLYIQLKPVFKGITEFFGFEDSSLADTLTGAKDIGEIAAKVFALLAVAFTVITGVVVALAAAFAGLVAAMVAVPLLLGEIARRAGEFVKSVDFAQMGADMIAGLARGITASAGFVKDAIGKAVTGAIKHAKGLLGIASPSKVFAQLGEYTGEGFEVGVEDTTSGAQDALANLVSPLSAQDALSGNVSGSQSSTPSPAASTGGGSTLDLSGATFNFYGVEGAENAEQRFGEIVTRLLEGDATSLGTEVPT